MRGDRRPGCRFCGWRKFMFPTPGTPTCPRCHKSQPIPCAECGDDRLGLSRQEDGRLLCSLCVAADRRAAAAVLQGILDDERFGV
jgi:hypothetical protein